MQFIINLRRSREAPLSETSRSSALGKLTRADERGLGFGYKAGYLRMLGALGTETLRHRRNALGNRSVFLSPWLPPQEA